MAYLRIFSLVAVLAVATCLPQTYVSRRTKVQSRTSGGADAKSLYADPMTLARYGETTIDCPAQFGLYPIEDVCFQFVNCYYGKAAVRNCPFGLVFNPSISQCDWPDVAQRSGCTSKDLWTFRCPANLLGPEFFPFEGDCRAYLECLPGDINNIRSCPVNTIFDPLRKKCIEATDKACENVAFEDTLGGFWASDRSPLSELEESESEGVVDYETIISPVERLEDHQLAATPNQRLAKSGEESSA